MPLSYMRPGFARRAGLYACLALATFFWLYSGLAHAADAHIPDSPLCLTEADATAKTSAWLKLHEGAALKIVDGDNAASWLAAFNAMKPTSDYRADKIWVLFNPADEGTVTVALFDAGQTCHTAHMPAAMFVAIARAAKGT